MKDLDNLEVQLKIGFIEEAAQLIADTENCFLTLESNPSDRAVLEKIFRLFHNLKGSAKAVGFDDLGAFTHELESFLIRLRSGEMNVSQKIVNFLLLCNDRIRVFVEALQADFNAKVDYSDIIEKIEVLKSEPQDDSSPQAEEPSVNEEATTAELTLPSSVAPSGPTLTSVSASESVSEVAEVTEVADSEPEVEVYAAPPSGDLFDELAKVTETRLQDPANAAAAHGAGKEKTPAAANTADESIRVSLGRVEKLINYVGELVIVQTVLQEQSSNTESLLLRKTVHQLGKITKEVQDLSMSLRMVPLKQTFLKMQRIVRDTAQTVGKKVQLELIGEETEVDKTVLERLSDPLVHMIRNAVDHGIEDAETRKQRGKSDVGNIKLSAYHQSGNLIIEVQDDGGGMDANKLRKKAIDKGLINPNAVLSDQEAFQLIFLSGFSTKEQVSDVSGRGVGMDVVNSNIKQLQGDIQIETELGKMSLFRVKLPLTLAIIHGMVIHSCNDRYVIPLAHVHESLRPRPEDIKYVSGAGEILILRNENIPLYRISHILNKKGATDKEPWDGIAIVVRTQAMPFAVLVDDIIGQFQIVIKSLSKEIQKIKGFSGSAILGDGRPALILELAELIKRAKPIENTYRKLELVEKRSVA